MDRNAREQTALWAAANWHRRRGYAATAAGRPQRRLVSTRARRGATLRLFYLLPEEKSRQAFRKPIVDLQPPPPIKRVPNYIKAEKAYG